MRNAKLAVLFVCRALGLFWLARRVTSKRLRILCYHGFELDDETSFRDKLFITGRRFERRLATIRRKNYHVLGLDEAVKGLYQGDLPADCVVITADDGFHSFSRIAAPLLRRFEFPATVYVTTYHVQHASPVFNLVVQYMFWKRRKSSVDLEALLRKVVGDVNVPSPVNTESATSACIEFGRRLGSESERQELCRLLGQQLDVPYDQIVNSRILTLMNAEDFATLPGSRIDVQLHTHRHVFPSDDRAAADREISDNRAALLTLSPGIKRHFCYPSGIWHRCQWEWLDEMGIRSSTTCVPGLNDGNTPRHALRRFLDGDNIHQLEFEAALSGFSEVFRIAKQVVAPDPPNRIALSP